MISLTDWLQVKDISHSLVAYMEPKIVASASLAAYAFFLSPLYLQLQLALIALLTFDAITGVMAAKYTGTSITARRLFRTPQKMFVYILLVSAAHLADLFIISTGAYFEFFMMFYLALTEFTSVIENIGKMGFKTPRKLLNQITDRMEESRR